MLSYMLFSLWSAYLKQIQARLQGIEIYIEIYIGSSSGVNRRLLRSPGSAVRVSFPLHSLFAT
jgi:hypothetical protein